MTTITFDTYKLIQVLIQKGFTKEQSEGLLETFKGVDVSHLATKEAVKQEIKDESQVLKDEFKQEVFLLHQGMASLETQIANVKADTFKFIIIVAGVQTAIIGLMLSFFAQL